MRKAIVFVAIISIISSASAALAGSNCIKTDPWDPTEPLRVGPYRGECVITDHQRSAQVLSTEELKKLGLPSSNGITIANLWHAKKFWIAHIPENSVSGVYFQKIQFGNNPAVAHAQIRFKLNKPVELLYDQKLGRKVLPTADDAISDGIREITVSVEAARSTSTLSSELMPLGAQYAFVLVTRVMSTSERIREMREGKDNPPEEYALDFSSFANDINTNLRPQDAVLFSALRTSQENGTSHAYHFLFANCTSEAFRIIDQALTYPKAFWTGPGLSINNEALAEFIQAALKDVIGNGDIESTAIVQEVKGLSGRIHANELNGIPSYIQANLAMRGLIPVGR